MMNSKIMRVDLSKLLELDNVVLNPGWENWQDGPISRDEINFYIKYVKLDSPNSYDPDFPETREEHLKRIVYYILNGWNFDPIYITRHNDNDYIWDGVHRVIAAYFRNEEWIIAEVNGNQELIEYLSY